MKKNIKLFLSIVLGSLLFACNEQLDLPSDGRISMDEVFSDLNRTKGYLNSCYGYCPKPDMDRASFTDEAQDADDITAGSGFSMWYAGNITSSNYASYSVDGSPWNSLFEGIRKCNVFLKNIETASVYATEEVKAGWKAQAHTLRALYYLQLIKRYGGVPIFDEPLEIDHDFSKDNRASFSEVVAFILADCDAALEVPDTEEGFHWAVYDHQFEIMTRAVAYAIKSEAVTYAASPLWSDGTYTWEDATEINKEALYQCLSNDYELFSEAPLVNAAQNAYALYFITSSDDMRSHDKETIYQCGTQMEVWKYAGLPTTNGVEKAGPCPTQDLIDAYEMANGEAPITGYSDNDRLIPFINAASGYDPVHPYQGRDPRFYASIYYNEAQRYLNEGPASIAQELQTSTANHLTITETDTSSYDLTTTGGDPYVFFSALTAGMGNPSSVKLNFEYKASTYLSSLQIFLAVGGALSEANSIHPADIPPATDWTSYTIDLTSAVSSMGFGAQGDFLRFDFGTAAGVSLSIRNITIDTETEGERVETYVSGDEQISETNRKYTRTGYYQRKFNNYLSENNNSADGAIRLFRLAELYLNFAESAYQSHGPDVEVTLGNGMTMSAREAVDRIRGRAGMPGFPTGMSASDFEKKYRNERRIELAFEEHRFFDVRRWKILDQTDAFVTGMRITKSGEDYIYTRFKFANRNCSSDKFLIYPIDQDEVNKIIAISGIDWQNPGW